MALTPSGPNAEQIEYWNQVAGPKWVELEDMLDAQIRDLGIAAMDAVGIARDEHVLDVGCGCGHTTLALAERVGPRGRVLGIDISSPMLSRAAERADAAGARHARFENADAQTHPFEQAAFDALFSRFGVMFFAQPESAFENLARALRPGGRVGFVCWQEVARNPWMLVPLSAAAKCVSLPAPPGPDAPGPFSFADRARVERILRAAGLEDVRIEPIEQSLRVGGGGGIDDAVRFLMRLGPAAAALREAAPETEDAVAGAIREALEPYETPEGVCLDASAWIVAARRA